MNYQKNHSKLSRLDWILIVFTASLLALTLLLTGPFVRVFYSMGIMAVYSDICEKDSLLVSENIDLHIPGGLSTLKSDWFPFVMTFHPGNSFGYSVRKDCSLTILYNFPAFSPIKGCSKLYDPESPYYSSFYGAYLVKSNEPYGFITDEDGRIVGVNEEDTAAVAKYDYKTLVLSDFGLSYEDFVFDFKATNHEENITYAGSNGWYKIDAELTVSGCAHEKSSFAQSYLQYGIPNFAFEEPFAPVKMYGRMYGKYIEEKKTSVFFYIIAADVQVLEECDNAILSKSTLSL
ncbi:MAG: hypothetical protein IJX08_05050 [Clostridia bacterium]|nr:hypothetical protein [Clostridia bacterium]